MNFEVHSGIEKFLILGAGSSVDYGLPVWADLAEMIKDRISADVANKYSFKKEIPRWVDKVGEGKSYATLDQCLSEESVAREFYTNGHQIENEIFRILKDIFDEKYTPNEDGWIRSLNEKILRKSALRLEQKIAFVSFNYDEVLDRNLLDLSHLPEKHKVFNLSGRLKELSGSRFPILYAHGNLYSNAGGNYRSYLFRSSNTMKSGNQQFIDAVSCFESQQHYVATSVTRKSVKLYILGLGGGMQINLSNLNFMNPVSEVHVTIKNKQLKDAVLRLLADRYELETSEIHVYPNCSDLVESCFDE